MGTEVIAIVVGVAMLFGVSIAMALKAKKDKDAQD
jgi:hypothetical protein